MKNPIARIIIDSSVPQLGHVFDYRVPESLAAHAVEGVRVRVPLRTAGRIVDGFLIARTDATEFSGTLNQIDSIVSPVPVLQPEIWRLISTVAERQAGNPRDIIRLAIPPRQVRVEKAWLADRAPRSTAESDDTTGPAAVKDDRPTVDDREATRIALAVGPGVTQLSNGTWVGNWARELASRAVAAVRRNGSAIVAVPDYRDHEQLSNALAMHDVPVVRVDARQTNPERYRSFLRTLEADPCVIIGNRSALYAAAPRLELIALWDDGDPLFSEPLAPYAHARDVALIRQAQSGADLVFASYSRSVDVQRLVEIGFLDSVRTRDFRTPRIIATAKQLGSDSPAQRARIPSTAWEAARKALDDGPVLVQVSRPGYAPLIACGSCREVARCAHCAGPLGIPTAGATPACRWCGALASAWDCPHCRSHNLRIITPGVGRTAEDLGRAFPGVPIRVSDGEKPLITIDAHPALVIATRGAEPLAEGGYAAILLLDGERMLARESLRVAEECVRWWSNAAALAARGAPIMLVGVGEPFVTTLAAWQHEQFAAQELADRRQLRFPPAIRVACIRGEEPAVREALAGLPEAIQTHTLGPVGIENGDVRAVVRFEYRDGAAVAELLRSAVVRRSVYRSGSVYRSEGLRPVQRRRVPQTKGAYRKKQTLTVHFDDPEIF